MKKEIITQIEIDATAQSVWKILTDFDKYPEWNPFIHSLKGLPIVGQKLDARIQNMEFKPTVLVFDENKEFRWLGHFLFKGLFDGEHRFQLKENPNGTTTFTQSERFKGILVRLMAKTLDTKTTAGFHAMNEKLKLIAEQE
jgi:hypothetical protein